MLLYTVHTTEIYLNKTHPTYIRSAYITVQPEDYEMFIKTFSCKVTLHAHRVLLTENRDTMRIAFRLVCPCFALKLHCLYIQYRGGGVDASQAKHLKKP